MLKDREKGVVLQRDKETYAIVVHLPLGLVTVDILQKLTEIAKKYEIKAMKITSANRIALIGFKEEEIDSVWEELGVEPGAATGLCVRSVKVCPGVTFCRLGQQDTLDLGAELDKRFHRKDLPNKFKLGVSGCVNDCAETCIKDLGFIGKPNGWSVTVGGCGGARPLLAKKLIKDVSTEEALEIAERVIKFYKENGRKGERLGRLIERLGWEEFCKKVL